MKTVIEYQCEICEGRFPTQVQATACERVGFKPLHQVGEIVFAKSGFGWYDGQDNWVSNPDVARGTFTARDGGDYPLARKVATPREECPNGNHNCWDECCCFKFYYVITAIDKDDRDRHRPRYHLATLAMSGKEGYRGGHTFDIGHERIKTIKNPPAFVVKESRTLLGQVFNNLL